MINKHLKWTSKAVLAAYMSVHVAALCYSLYEPLTVHERIMLMIVAVIAGYVATALHAVRRLNGKHVLRAAVIYAGAFLYNPFIAIAALIDIGWTVKQNLFT